MKNSEGFYAPPEKPKLIKSADLLHVAKSHVLLAPLHVIDIDFPFLKDFMMGILPTELLLLGAKTGSGKTQILTEFSLMWSRLGKRVAFIALEAEPEEIELRILYKLYCKAYLEDKDKDPNLYLDFRRWRFGRLEKDFAKYDQIVDEQYLVVTKNLSTHYMKKAEFTIIDLIDLMDDVKMNADVCIIDHLHYFDLLDNKNDLQGMRQLMKRVRILNLESKIPFVMAAHLRKDIDKLMPGVDDFMGSSDISKIATSAIMLAAKPDGYNSRLGTQSTLISVPKLRGGGGTRLIGEVDFSVSHQMYLPTYALNSISQKGDKLYAIQREDYPRWAKTPEEQWTFDI